MYLVDRLYFKLVVGIVHRAVNVKPRMITILIACNTGRWNNIDNDDGVFSSLVIVTTAGNKEIFINTRARIDATLFVLRLFFMSYCNRLQRHENEGGYDYIYTIPNLLILYYYHSINTPPRDKRCYNYYLNQNLGGV